MTVLHQATWKVRDGRFADTVAMLPAGQKLIEKHGGSVRTFVTTLGGAPNAIVVITECADLEAFARYTNALNRDPDWRTFMATHVLGPDPKVELIGTTLLHQLA